MRVKGPSPGASGWLVPATALALLALSFAPARGQQPVLPEATTCQTDIVSGTVVSTFCGHREADVLRLDLLILWRGSPGWFQRSWMGGGSSGSHMVGRGFRGAVSQSTRYGDVTIAFEANFETSTAIVESTTLRLDRINTVLVDAVDGDRRVVSLRRTDPALPLVGDWNLALAKQSPEFLRDLQCAVPMPKASPMWRVPVRTVCERLKDKE